MRRTALSTYAALLAAAAFCTGVLLGCGGRQVPDHDGYRERWVKGWKKPKTLDFDEYLEAEADGELSYPRRRRARWFAVDLPRDGSLEVLVRTMRLGVSPEEADLVAVDNPFDLGFEIYNSEHQVLARADRAADDVGEREKSRTVKNLPKGRYLIHLYLQRRLDEAEFTLRVKFKRGSADPETDFPRQVAFVGPLPVVPAFDDAPAPRARPRCRGRKCGQRKPRPRARRDNKPTPNTSQPEASTPAPDSMRGRVIVVRGLSGGGTAITINQGSSKGVEAGWKGQVVTKAGNPIPGGSFTITSVKANSSNAKVKASPDAVKQAARVRLKAP